MNETVNQENTVVEQEERTFTQSEMNAIIQDRLSRERGKYSDYESLKAKAAKYDEAEEAAKSELQKATERADALQIQLDAMTKAEGIRTVREKVSAEKNVPATLLTGETEEACVAQAEAILTFAGRNGYPSVKDGGEITNTFSRATPQEQFEEWFNNTLR